MLGWSLAPTLTGEHKSFQYQHWELSSKKVPLDSPVCPLLPGGSLSNNEKPWGQPLNWSRRGSVDSLACVWTPASPNAHLKIPGHLRPVILKPVGRIFENSDSKPIRGKCGKCGKSFSPQKKGSEEIPQSKNAKNAENADAKRGKCG